MNSVVVYNKIKHLSTYGLAVFLFLTPFEYPLADMMVVSPLRIVGLIAMGVGIFDIFCQKTIKFDYRFIGVLLWILYGLVTIMWVTNEERFQAFYSIYLNNAIMFLLFSIINYTKHEAEILKKSMIAGVGALLIYMSFVPDAVVYSEFQNRLTLNAGKEGLDQNYLAALMLISFGLLFYDLCNKSQKKTQKAISIIFCTWIVYYIILTGSRSGLIAVLFIVLLSINTSWKTRLLVGIPVVLLFVIGLPMITEHLPKELLDRFSLTALTGKEVESGTRLIIWQRALDSLRNFKWIFGHGVGSSQTVVGNAIGIGKDMAIHNHYIAMLTEVGIFGFLMINYPVFKMIKKVGNDNKNIAISFLGIIVMAIFVDVVTTKFFWSSMILLSVCCANKKMKKY